MSGSKLNRLRPIGLLMLAAGLSLHVWMPADYAQSVSAFLLGLSGVSIVFGFLHPKPGAPA